MAVGASLVRPILEEPLVLLAVDLRRQTRNRTVGSLLATRPSALEDFADDLATVMDEVGSEKAALLGTEDGCFVCSMFAATHPVRTEAIVLYGMDPGAPDSGLAYPPPERQAFRDEVFRMVDRHSASREYAVWDMQVSYPSLADDESFLSWYRVFLQLAASPGCGLGSGLRSRGRARAEGRPDRWRLYRVLA